MSLRCCAIIWTYGSRHIPGLHRIVVSTGNLVRFATYPNTGSVCLPELNSRLEVDQVFLDLVSGHSLCLEQIIILITKKPCWIHGFTLSLSHINSTLCLNTWKGDSSGQATWSNANVLKLKWAAITDAVVLVMVFLLAKDYETHEMQLTVYGALIDGLNSTNVKMEYDLMQRYMLLMALSFLAVIFLLGLWVQSYVCLEFIFSPV